MKDISWQGVTIIVAGLALAGFMVSQGNDAAVALVITNVMALFTKPFNIVNPTNEE